MLTGGKPFWELPAPNVVGLGPLNGNQLQFIALLLYRMERLWR